MSLFLFFPLSNLFKIPLAKITVIGYNIVYDVGFRILLVTWRVGSVRRGAVNHVRRGTEQH